MGLDPDPGPRVKKAPDPGSGSATLKKDTMAKCHNLKLLTCKGTLRQVLIRVYRLEIISVMLVFSTQICELLPLLSSLWFNSPPTFVNKQNDKQNESHLSTACILSLGHKGGEHGRLLGPQEGHHYPACAPGEHLGISFLSDPRRLNVARPHQGKVRRHRRRQP
jgi:hypothetical protein